MNENVIFVIYKLVSIAVGCVIVYWGYNLFRNGYNSVAGEFVGIWANKKIVLKNAAPGTFLFILGATIALVSVFKGMEVKSHTVQRTPIENLNIKESINDTINLSDEKSTVNIDSIFELAKKKFNEKKYFNSLKYLYYLKGYVSNSDKDNIIKKDLDFYIQVVESSLTEQSNKNESFFDETKSTKINDENLAQDSLK